MNKIKDNLKIFFATWFFVLFANQAFIFGGCFQIYCILAALPHTGFISFWIAGFIIKANKPQEEENQNKEKSYYRETNTLSEQSKEAKDEIIKDKPEATSNDNIQKRSDKIKKLVEERKKRDKGFVDSQKAYQEPHRKQMHKKEERSIQTYEDREFEKLKLTLKILEKELQILSELKTEYLSEIEEFNRQYSLRLGAIIENILNLKREILYKQTIKQQKLKEKYQEEQETFDETKATTDELRNTIDELEEALSSIDESHEQYDEIYQAYQELQEELETLEQELHSQEQKLHKTKEQLEDDELEEAFEEAKQAYEEYHQEYMQTKDENAAVLNEDEKKELKRLYKKAARLCHPDIVVDALKEKAHEIMQALNSAYGKKDIAKISEILNNLENGRNFEISSDTVKDKEVLRSKVKEYESAIEDLEVEIEQIKNNQIFATISSLDNWDEYFEELKDKLEIEQQALEDEARGSLRKSQESQHDDEDKEDKFTDSDNDKTKSESKNNVLKIELTSTQYLNHYNEKETRELLFDGTIKKPELSLEHESNNTYDDLAIKVYCNGTFIGYVLKYKNKQYIEQFCFENRKLKNMLVMFVDREIVLSIAKTTEKEISAYASHINSIENIKFEKIRKYCENLAKENQADEMQKYIGSSGKMHKALIYDALEQFIERLNTHTITLLDWGCDQGIASMLVLDYIKEKQLDIKVNQILLVEKESKKLSRAMAQVKALDFSSAQIEASRSLSDSTNPK